ncbi:MAG: DUF1998 domain-containing protein [Bryobacteraceae bacterium]
MSGERVGAVRPTQLLSTYGVGATVDLPQISVMVMGLDDWPLAQMEDIGEDRLLRVVRSVIGGQVRTLKSAPLAQEEGLLGRSFGTAPPEGVPVAAFPRWLVCTHCHLLAPIASSLFDFKADLYRPERSRYVHTNCIRPGTLRPEAIPARFLIACEQGHLDDFPWHEYLHGDGPPCISQLELRDLGVTGEAIDVRLKCRVCEKSRPMALAFSEDGRARLPRCRGWHPHLRVAPAEGCGHEVRPMLLGATNQWFSKIYSALSIPTSVDPLEQKVSQDLTSLFDGIESAREAGLARRGLPRYEGFSDEQIWAAIQKIRDEDSVEFIGPHDLKLPEWQLFSRPNPARNNRDLQVRLVSPPSKYGRWIEQVVLVEKLREVRALVGFTRVEAAGDDSTSQLAPLRRGTSDWVPAAEVRGEGLFLQISETEVERWLRQSGTLDGQFLTSHRRWREQRNMEPNLGYPGLRYVLLHSLSHALIRQFSLECGYASASLSERIYSAYPDSGESMAGILIYTAAPDSEGTLGGLVSLGETEALERHFDQALESLEICASDPLCAESRPDHGSLALHGAACHNCLFLPETCCERGNRYLDRSVLVNTLERNEYSFFKP